MLQAASVALARQANGYHRAKHFSGFNPNPTRLHRTP